MKAMILAAGRGERMRPLTDTVPKPLLEVQGKPLIVWHVEKLAASGFQEIIINVAHLGSRIIEYLQDGSKWGVKIIYSDERECGALESAGGIKKALPFFQDQPFLVVNGDVFCNYQFDLNKNLGDKLAHLVLVPNPPHNPKGDFALQEDLACNSGDAMFTFSGIGYYSPKLFESIASDTPTPLAPLLRQAIEKKQVSAELFTNLWHDIGTPQRLEEINRI